MTGFRSHPLFAAPAVVSTLAAGALVAGGVLAAGALLPAARVRASPVAAAPCSSAENPAVAKKLGTQIQAALAGRTGTESVAVYDRKRGIRCAVAAGSHYDSASVVKATILGALLRKVTDGKRSMTTSEKSLANKMITRSDNAAASTLWRSVGRTRMSRFLKQAEMTHTTLGPSGYWGLTQITAQDQIELLSRYTTSNALLPDHARAYALKLMNSVIASQRWGTPAGHPANVTWHVKNGWLPRHGRDWRVHSIGAFDGHGEDYMIVVLTRDTPSMAYGVQTIERVARTVHRTLNPGIQSIAPESTPNNTWETSDGSVPADR
ncbi:serine hydrolase [Actinomadura macra]|uniref:serine hydrolase n=1 Tax=Actinomadura macra TaxID=46164 RepID=UPI00082B64F4|nr:serine hydrolase [Actinomadura macra]